MLVEPKSRAGRRRIALPAPLVERLRSHRHDQRKQRLLAGSLWEEHGLVFTQPTGRPIDPRSDWGHWKALLAAAGVRDARLHDARHTAATLLLVQGVNARTVMDVMGWTEARMLSRYQHVVDELRRDAADRMGRALWPGAESRRQLRLKLRPRTNLARLDRGPEHKTAGQRAFHGAALGSRTPDLRITSASL